MAAKRITPADLAKNGTEHGHQAALLCWTTQPDTRENFPDASKIYANNNNAGAGDAERGAMRGMRAKMVGVKKGVADLFLPVMRHGKGGLYLEMKKPEYRNRKNGGLKPEQIEFRAQALEDGYGYAVAYTWEEAASIVSQYLTP